MSFKDKKPNIISEGYYYSASEMDEYLAIVEPKAEKWDLVFDDIQEMGFVGTAENLKQLKEKAEKLDELFPNPHIIEETGGTMCELLIEQAGKLEAIREICLTMHRVNRQKALKILDGENKEAS